MNALLANVMRGRRTRALVAMAAFAGLVGPAAARAAVQDIEATGTYHLGDNDSKLVGHRLALMEAKRTALEKAGTYVESFSEVKDAQITRDEVRTYSAGLLKVEETREPEWKMVGKNMEVTVYVKVQVDGGDVAQRMAVLHKDKDTTRQLKETQAKVDANEKKIQQLNKQLKTAKKGAPSTQRAQQARAEALEDIDASTLKAQAAVAQKYSVQAYNATKSYMQRQLPAIKGCYHSLFSSGAQAAARPDTGLAWLAGPPVLVLCWRRRSERQRRGRRHT